MHLDAAGHARHWCGWDGNNARAPARVLWSLVQRSALSAETIRLLEVDVAWTSSTWPIGPP